MPRKKAAETAEPKKTRKPRAKKTEEKVEKRVVPRAVETSSVDDLLDCKMQNTSLVNQLKALGFKSKDPEGMTFREAIICGQITQAVKGDLKAYRAVMDYAGKDKTRMPLEDYVLGSMGLVVDELIGGEKCGG